MYHSVYFGNKNTFTDWHLVPDGRPLVVMPDLKSTTVDVPGANGLLDLSEVLTNYPVYQNRKGKIKFHVLTSKQERELGLEPLGDWHMRYQAIALYLQGQIRKMRLEDDPDWYYEGRYSIAWNSENNGSGSTLEINYELDPLKYNVYLTAISKTVESGTPQTITFFENGQQSMPVIADIDISALSTASLLLSFTNPELGIENREDEFAGTATRGLYSFPLSNMSGENQPTLVATGGATFTLTYREALL